MSSVDHLAKVIPYGAQVMLDLEDQTPVIAGKHLGRRVLIQSDLLKTTLGGFDSDPSFPKDVWAPIKHAPLGMKGFHRRDHDFAVRGPARPVYFVESPTGRITGSGVTPIGRVKDQALALFGRSAELTQDAFTGHWNQIVTLSHEVATGLISDALNVGASTPLVDPTPDAITEDSIVYGPGRIAKVAIPVPAQETNAARVPSEAWSAFEALSGWLGRTDEETAELLGIGRTTAYTWRRSGREPQARTARRLYEAHAFVRQLVVILGQDRARAALARQDASGSALALIEAGRVSDAEALFADLIYQRPAADDVPLNAVTGPDEPVELPIRPDVREPAPRRRVQVGRRQ